jgi:riboflavin synthase
MFTGIVQELGTVYSLERARRSGKRADDVDRLHVFAPKTAAGLVPGESVAINGACLSVVSVRQGAMTFEIIPETRRLTNLGTLSAGARVNVERSLTLSDRLNGHVVLGHVDGVGRILRCQKKAGEVALGIRVDAGLRRYLVPKAPIAVDGVSLTVGARVASAMFSVFLIPETIHKTTLGLRRVGDLVNIEADYFAKLLIQFAQKR